MNYTIVNSDHMTLENSFDCLTVHLPDIAYQFPQENLIGYLLCLFEPYETLQHLQIFVNMFSGQCCDA